MEKGRHWACEREDTQVKLLLKTTATEGEKLFGPSIATGCSYARSSIMIHRSSKSIFSPLQKLIFFISSLDGESKQ